MASSIIIGLFSILLVAKHISGTCLDQYFATGQTNVLLEFKFSWTNTETKHVNCFGKSKIGQCLDIAGSFCGIEPTSTGVYNMASNADLTEVYVTIVTFNTTTSGNYSCSKHDGTSPITRCVKDSATTSTTPTSIGTTTPLNNEGNCPERLFVAADIKSVAAGENNVSLEYTFNWTTGEERHIKCFHGSKQIGECYDVFGYQCFLINSTNVYNMSTNSNLTVVNVTIITFDNSASGNYSCSKNSGTTTITKCVKPSGWTKACAPWRVVEIIGAGLLMSVVICVILLTVCYGEGEHCTTACCTQLRCRPKVRGILALGVILGVVFVIISVGITESYKRCEEGWSKLNGVAIGFGIIGDVLLISVFIATIKDLCGRNRLKVNNQ